MKTVTFKRVHSASRGNTSYRAEGFPGVIHLAKPAWNGHHPEELVVENVPEPIAKPAKSGAERIAKQLEKAQARVAALTLKAKEAEGAAALPLTTVVDAVIKPAAPKKAGKA